MKIGFTELIVILVVALVVLGPDKLPIYMKKLGVALREFRKYSSELTDDIKENIVAPLDEAQKPLREALEPLNQMEEELKSTKKDIEKSFADIGKVKKEEPVKEEAASEKAEETATAKVEETATAEATPVEKMEAVTEEAAVETVEKPAAEAAKAANEPVKEEKEA